MQLYSNWFRNQNGPMSNVGAFIRLNIKLLYIAHEIARQTIFSILLTEK
jgi:hypothetical protein